jgi:hypothetical protein
MLAAISHELSAISLQLSANSHPSAWLLQPTSDDRLAFYSPAKALSTPRESRALMADS